MNIKVVFIEKEILTENIKEQLEAAGATVIVVDKEHLKEEFDKCDMHYFHCCILGSNEFLEEVKDSEVRTIQVGVKW